MELNSGIFPKLLIGTFVVAILAFVVRGFSQLVVGAELARILAAPLFIIGVLMAVTSFILSVLVKLGAVGDEVAN
ncbi:hypothetical protein ACFQJ7_13555 [Halovenus rubra]|uniref:Uncharacterized protein n=2 Tax=Halovenus rubra TaxID=869890 RepID=A0ABD5X7D3_9EURY|nr:hypothetical protein [Halovenus rubra]